MTTSQRLTAGMLLGGRYRLVEPLPGAGRSWSARDQVDGRELIARLVVLPDTMPAAEHDRVRQRALHDAATISRVRHPGVAQVVDAVVEGGVPWVVSVRPAGRSIGELVRAHGPMPAARVARIGLQVLDALAAAGVPHGDLTPDDVLVGEHDRIVLTGFGTTPVDGTETPGFRAPEGGPSAAADLWALGVTLYLAVEARLPDGPGGGALRPVLDRLLAVEPARRSGGNDVRVLLALIGGTPVVGAAGVSDPEVAAALAAFDAALPTRVGPEAPGRLSPPLPPDDAPVPKAPPDAADPAAPSETTSPPAAAPRTAEPETREPETQEPETREPETREPETREPETQEPETRGLPRPVEGGAVPAGGREGRSRPPLPGAPARAGRRRWSGTAVAAVLVLVVVAVTLSLLLRRDGGDGSDDGGQPAAVTPPASSVPATPNPQVAAPPPAGYHLYRDPAGWSIGIPAGWTVGRAGHAVTFSDGGRVLSVRAQSGPPADPYRAQLALAPGLAKDTAGYDFLRIARVSYRGWPTSDWEYRSGGNPVRHTLIRSTVPTGRHAYEITWTVPDRRWTADKPVFAVAAGTFDPGA
jgi:hypothetical protein